MFQTPPVPVSKSARKQRKEDVLRLFRNANIRNGVLTFGTIPSFLNFLNFKSKGKGKNERE